MKTLFAPAVAAVLLLAGAASASAQKEPPQMDSVLLADGSTVKCRITRCTYQTVVYNDEKGKPVTRKGSEIGAITFSDEPMAFASARNAVLAKQVEKAQTRFEEALKEVEAKKCREWNKAPILIHWGQFLAERGDAIGALAMLKRIRTECGDSWWRPESYRHSIDIGKTKGIEAQKEVLDEMKAEPEPLASEAEMSLAELAITRNEIEEALSIYQKVAANASSAYNEAAKIGVFRTYKKQQRSGDLDSYSKKLLDDPTSTPALQQAAGAWVASSQLEKAGKDKSKIRAAILAAGKAIAMGPPERKEEAEDYIAALRVAAKGYAALAGEAAKAEIKQEYKQRASGYLMEIVRAYKGTPWAEAAQLELQTLGVQEN
jgi:hypothetical protein